MSDVLFPREAGRLIAETSKDVTVNQPGVEKIASLILAEARCGRFGQNTWGDHELNPTSADRTAVEWMFVVDVLNFSFWAPDGCCPYSVTFRDNTYTGYWALCATINRALDEGLPMTDPDYYASLSLEDLKKIFRSDSDGEIPMLTERHEALVEAGKVLLKKYRGSFVNCIKECDRSAQTLLKLIVQNFPAFRDEADFNGRKVGLYKRAQIVIGDIWAACDGKGLGEFNDISSLTMFPDYRIPQVLAYYGALEYSDSLTTKLREDNLLKNGERLEVEIRGCSIWAIELIVEEVKKRLAKDPDLKGTSCCAVNVDHFLWDYREDCAEDMESIPFHKTRSIYY